MQFTHRIAAGGIVIHNDRILLVRYRGSQGTYLVAPGGGIEDGEALTAAAEREVEEETGIQCAARWPVMIENIRATRYQMVKIWYLCDYVSGVPMRTPGAVQEEILEVGWYTDEDLSRETVYPDIVPKFKTAALRQLPSTIIDSGIRHADF